MKIARLADGSGPTTLIRALSGVIILCLLPILSIFFWRRPQHCTIPFTTVILKKSLLCRYAAKRFRKAQCPIVERLVNSLMMHGRNTGENSCRSWFISCGTVEVHTTSRNRILKSSTTLNRLIILSSFFFKARSWWPWGLWSTPSKSSTCSPERTLSR